MKGIKRGMNSAKKWSKCDFGRIITWGPRKCMEHVTSIQNHARNKMHTALDLKEGICLYIKFYQSTHMNYVLIVFLCAYEHVRFCIIVYV